MAHLVGQQGYAETNVAQVIQRAGVSRKAFYEYFSEKEDCFLAAYEALASRMVADLAEARFAGPTRVREQLARYLEVLSRDPVMARACIVEVMGAGPRALKVREEVNQQFASLVFGHTSRDPVVRRALTGGVNDVVSGELLRGARDLRPLLGSLVRFVEPRRRITSSRGRRPSGGPSPKSAARTRTARRPARGSGSAR